MSLIFLEPLKPEHFIEIERRPQTLGLLNAITPERAAEICESPLATAVSCAATGRLLAVGGISMRWEGRGEAWVFFAPNTGKYMEAITDAALVALQICEVNRIEALVSCAFQQGHTWAHRLGFNLEASCLEAYGIDGGDCAMYARIKKGRT